MVNTAMQPTKNLLNPPIEDPLKGGDNNNAKGNQEENVDN
jgi:hypothetical protein